MASVLLGYNEFAQWTKEPRSLSAIGHVVFRSPSATSFELESIKLHNSS